MNASPQLTTDPDPELPPDASPEPLSPRDWDIFAAALEYPPPANEALKKAMNRRAERLRDKK